MKTNKLTQKNGMSQFVLGLLVTSVLMTLGCSKSTNNSQSVGSNVTVPGSGTGGTPDTPGTDNTDNGGTSTITGSVVTFTMKDLATFKDYVGPGRVLNNPSTVKLKMDVRDVGGGKFGGGISISYYDNGIFREGVFTAGSDKNAYHKDLRDNDKMQAEYNYWFNYSGTSVFSGYFQDSQGAIVVVISPDNTGVNPGDGQGTSGTYAGHVYYKNFKDQGMSTTMAPNSMRACWFTYLGPLDCRSTVVTTKCGLYPGPETGYKFLGSFKGLNLQKAFNM